MGRTKQMDVKDSLRIVASTARKSTGGNPPIRSSRKSLKEEDKTLIGKATETRGHGPDPNIQYNREYVFYVNGKEVRMMPVVGDNNTDWLDLTNHDDHDGELDEKTMMSTLMSLIRSQQSNTDKKKKAVKNRKRKSTIKKMKETASQLKIESVKSIQEEKIRSTEESKRKKTNIKVAKQFFNKVCTKKIKKEKVPQKNIKVENDDYKKMIMKGNQDQDIDIKTEFTGGFDEYLRHETERTSTIFRIISDYENQSAALEKELRGNCDKLRAKHILASMVTLIEELKWANRYTGAERIKTEYMEYDLKQEPL